MTSTDIRTESKYEATLAVTVTGPTRENVNQWIETLADLLEAEHGQHMRINTRLNPPTLPRDGDWNVTHDGHTIHRAATRAEAVAVATYAIRQETNDPTLQLDWACPACYGDDLYCQDCSDNTVSYLHPFGVLTDKTYAVQHTALTHPLEEAL